MPITIKPTAIKTAILACLLAIPLTLQAQVYKQTDEEGNVTFTDQPTNQAEVIDVPPANTVTPVEIQVRPETSTQKEASFYQSLRITSPEDGSVIPNGPGNFSVHISLSPALQEGDQIQLLLNDKVHQSGSQSQLELTSIPRGNHSLKARVVSEKGNVLINSTTINIQVYRPSTAIYDNNDTHRAITPAVPPINPAPRAPK